MNVELLFMKGNARLLMVLAALCPSGLTAQGIADIVSSLRSAGCYRAGADFSVTLPQSDADVVYNIDLTSMAAPADTLAPCQYLIEWSLDTPSGPTKGFSSYFDGNHYRYSNNRLQEYHTGWDAMPFKGTARTGGVQQTAQFAELLPQFMADKLEAMASDSLYTLTIGPTRTFDGHTALPLTAVMTLGGETVMEQEYLFDATTLMPLRVSTESNPASIAEQTMLVTYKPLPDAKCEPLSEEYLVGLYPEEFSRFRESNFRIESLSGTPMPTFALPTSTGERYAHHRGEGFRAPTVIAIMDPATGFNSDIVNELRGAMDRLDTDADLIFAFTGTNASVAEEAAGPLRPGEHLLINARSLARDCGAASLPVFIVADSRAIVKNVILGVNKNLGDVVIQSIALGGE